MEHDQFMQLLLNNGGGMSTLVLGGLWLRAVIMSRFNAQETRLKAIEDRVARIEGSLLTPAPVSLPPIFPKRAEV
jgi:hypothetical protein